MNFGRKAFSVIGTLLLASALLAACGSNNNAAGNTSASTADQPAANETKSATNTAEPSAPAEPEVRVLTDAVGHEVKVPTHPKRVIAPFLEDPLVAMGFKPVAQWGIATEPQVYLQKWLQDVPVMNLSNGLDPELTLSYSPDLIIFTSPSWIKNGTYESYAKIAPTYVLSNDDQDWRQNLIKLGEVLDKEADVDKALKEYDSKRDETKEKLKQAIGDKKIAILLPMDNKSFNLFGQKFYSAGVLYEELGLKAPAMITGDFDSYSMEKLADLNDVDYLFVLTGKGRSKPPVDNPLWKTLPAVKNGNVFEVDAGHWFNSNAIANGLIMDDLVKYLVKK